MNSCFLPIFDFHLTTQAYMKKTFIFLMLFMLVSSGCSKYGSVSLRYPAAPLAYLPEDIHTLALVNRSKGAKKDSALVEAIVSGEVAGSDRLASDQALAGVFDRMQGWYGIQLVLPQETGLFGTGTGTNPEPLDWNTVQAICDSNGADALLVLETFDSNSDLLASVVNEGINSLINGTTPQPVRQIRMQVQCFWRLYDPKNRQIADQYRSSSFMTFDAGTGLIAVPPPNALPTTAYYAGQEYIQRFLPTYFQVSRRLYKRGTAREKQQFLSAFRNAEVADWEGAMEKWKVLAGSANRENAGRACLNVAVSCEVLGNIGEAIVWAQKAYTDYGNKTARDYQERLRYRMRIEY